MLLAMAAITAVFALAGCEGDDGNDGDPGPAGADGVQCWDLNENGIRDPEEDLNGDGVVDVLDCNALANQPDADKQAAIARSKSESCSTCHTGAGEGHQEIYNKYVDDSLLTLTFDEGDVASVDNGNGTFTVSVEFAITRDGAPLNDPGLSSLPQKRFYAVQYFSDTHEYLNSCSMSIADVDPAAGVYSATDSDCPYAPELSNAQVYGYIADTPLVQHEGGAGSEIPSGSHVHLYDNVANTGVGFGTAAASDPDSYVSAANVSGCEKCHGAPYLKHGYRAAEVDGLPDFAACKSCHYDNRTGGHEDWQYMVDDPFNWATAGLAEEVVEDRYAYTANIMNDVHMAHGMEFPYPQSMATCNTCHEGKLDEILTDEYFVAETCKSCHPVMGTDAWPPIGEEDAEMYYQAGRAPPMEYIWTEEGVDSFHNMDLNCQNCHVEGQGLPVFSDLHTGYDPRIYTADGQRYTDLYNASVDSVSVEGDLLTIEYSANNDEIVPFLAISFYGWNSKHFIVPSHTGDANRNRFEFRPGDDNPIFTEDAASVAGDWKVVVDMAAWEGGQPDSVPNLIAAGKVTKAEISVLPSLTIDGVGIGLNAATQTFDLIGDALVDNYFKGTAKIVDTDKCDACHDKLGQTFHGSFGVGGDIVACRNCHNPTYDGGHLEMASRSIDNYVHTIHSFQAFDTDEVFNDEDENGDPIPGYDPVFAKRYDQHIKHVFPNFTINNCEACHVTAGANDGGGGTYPVVYNVPDQSESMPGVLSATYDLETWYGVYPEDDPLEGLTFEDPSGRNIGVIPPYVTGPASRSCGGCHRARLINQDEAGTLASWNSHTDSFGTYSENDDEDEVLFGIIDKIMSMFE
jgi:OmcA/MtrC family decaheme c-type cytochrome